MWLEALTGRGGGGQTMSGRWGDVEAAVPIQVARFIGGENPVAVDSDHLHILYLQRVGGGGGQT
jgi:hypothetical protein